MNHHPTMRATDSWFDQLHELPGTAAERSPDRVDDRSADAADGRPVDQAQGRPIDQAQGLRRLFTSHTMRCIPLVSNPQLAFGGVLIERLCSAYAEMGLRTLVVDAGERARAPRELARFDLAEGIEPLGPQVGYLAARGLALRYVDAGGSTAAFLDALGEAAPDTDVLLVHAGAAELARLFARRVQELGAHALRPIVLCDEQTEGITHAYGAIKLLAQRAGLKAHDLLISAAADSPRAARVAERVAQCADGFLGVALHDWVVVDPTESATAPVSAALQQLVREQLACALPQRVGDSGFGGFFADSLAARAALPAQSFRHGSHALRAV